MLLETLSQTNDPQQAISSAFQHRSMLRRATFVHPQEQILGPGRLRAHGRKQSSNSMPVSHDLCAAQVNTARAAPHAPVGGLSSRKAPPSAQVSHHNKGNQRSQPRRHNSAVHPLYNRVSAPVPNSKRSGLQRRIQLPDRLRMAMSTACEEHTRSAPVWIPLETFGVDQGGADCREQAEAIGQRSRRASSAHVQRQNRARQAKARGTQISRDSMFLR